MQTHNLIDELFNQASNMEAQSKEDDACMLQMQNDLYKTVHLKGQMAWLVRAQIHTLIFKS